MKRTKNKILADEAVSRLKIKYPEAVCSLNTDGDAWRLLVMGRLSAQCTDERVNIVCEDLFKRFPSADVMAKADVAEVELLVRSCGLYKTKAQNIVDSSRIIMDEFGGKVPSDMEKLLSLPGVGRKIANLVRGDAFHEGGIVADTHCIRICGRLGFYDENKKDPVLCEKVMDPLIEKEEQSDFCHRMVMFGREVCTAKKPDCENCPLSDICKHGKAISK